MIWYALAFPVAGAAWLLWAGRWRVVWWEAVLPVALVAAVIFGCKLAGESAQVRDTEYWGGWATRSIYDEPWNERVPCAHIKYCRGRDSNGRPYRYACGHLHAYDVSYHPARWFMVDSNGAKLGIGKQRFENLSERWGNRKFIDMKRDYHTRDGDRYLSEWNQETATLEPITTKHTYENRVAASDSIFRFEKIENTKGLFDYPEIRGYYLPALLGKGGENRKAGARAMDLMNAELGARKQFRLWVLLFPPGTPRSRGLDQEAYWKGGNKNELVVTVGLDNHGSVAWAYPFSWMKSEDLAVEIRERLESTEGPLDLLAFAEWLRPEVEERFVRRPFAEFSYLSVAPPLWAVVLAYILAIIATIGCCRWAWLNEISERPPMSRGWVRNGRPSS
jgi:hypothetical protein